MFLLLFKISLLRICLLAPPFVSTYGVSNAPRMTEVNPFNLLTLVLKLNNQKQVSQPLPSTAAPLPKVPAKPDGAGLSTTAAEVRVQLVDKTPSLSNLVSVLPLSVGSSEKNSPLVDITASWQRFSQSIESWARTATPSSEMPLVNTKVKVVKDARSQVFVTIPGVDGRNPIKMTLQTLQASILLNSKKTSPPDQKTTVASNKPAAPNQLAAPNQPVAPNQPAVPNRPAAPDSYHEYRPYSVPQHQASHASASNGPLNINNLGNMTSAVPIAPSTHTRSSAVLSSSERTPSQANKKSLAKDILRALGFSSLKRSRPDDSSALRALEPPAKRLASGITSQTSGAVDVIIDASIKNVERSPQIAGTYPPQAVNSDQTTLTSVESESPVSRTKLLESALPQSSTAHNSSESHASSIETTSIASIQEVPQSSSSNNDDIRSVRANLSPNRPTTPLFLPSLSSSPPELSEEIPTDISSNTIQYSRRFTQPFYIIVPPQPFWVKQYKTQQSRKQGRWLVGESKRNSSSGILSDEETSLGRHRRVEDDNIDEGMALL